MFSQLNELICKIGIFIFFAAVKTCKEVKLLLWSLALMVSIQRQIKPSITSIELNGHCDPHLFMNSKSLLCIQNVRLFWNTFDHIEEIYLWNFINLHGKNKPMFFYVISMIVEMLFTSSHKNHRCVCKDSINMSDKYAHIMEFQGISVAVCRSQSYWKSRWWAHQHHNDQWMLIRYLRHSMCHSSFSSFSTEFHLH